MNVVLDVAQVFLDSFVSPAFKGPTEINADNFAQHARVNTFGIIVR